MNRVRGRIGNRRLEIFDILLPQNIPQTTLLLLGTHYIPLSIIACGGESSSSTTRHFGGLCHYKDSSFLVLEKYYGCNRKSEAYIDWFAANYRSQHNQSREIQWHYRPITLQFFQQVLKFSWRKTWTVTVTTSPPPPHHYWIFGSKRVNDSAENF